MSSFSAMPRRGERAAPSFNPLCPRDLPHYFSDLDHLLKSSGVTDSTKCKFFTSYFVDYATRELWQAIPEYTNHSTFAMYKTAIIQLYPEINPARRYNLADLEQIVQEQSHRATESIANYGEYFRRFLAVSSYLRSHGRLADIDEARAFTKGLSSALQQSVTARLAIIFPHHYPDDPYALRDIDEAARWILRTSSVTPAVSAPVPTPAPIPALLSPATPENDVKPPSTQELADRKPGFTHTLARTPQLRQIFPGPVFAPSPLVTAPAVSFVPPLQRQASDDKSTARIAQLERELFALRLARGDYPVLVRAPPCSRVPAPRQDPAPSSPVYVPAQNSASGVPVVPAPCAPTVACLLDSIQPPDAPPYPLDPSATSVHKTAHVTVANVLLSESYARAVPPRRPVDPTPHRSPISLPIDPARPLNAAKPTPDVSEQSTRDRDQIEVARPSSYIHHALPRPSATSASRISTVSRPIDPKLRSVDVSRLVSSTNSHSRESVQRKVVSKPSFVVSPYDRSTPRIAPVSPPTPSPRCTDDRRHRPCRSSHPACDANHRHRDNDPSTFIVPPPGITTRSAPASRPIVTPRRGNYVVDQSYQSSHSACESDHREATFQPYSAAVPRALESRFSVVRFARA